MQRHEGEHRRGVGEGVGVGVQADLLQEAVEAGLVGALVVLGGDADELLEVLEAAFRLERAFCALRAASYPLSSRTLRATSATGRPASPAAAADQRDERLQSGDRAAREAGHVVGLGASPPSALSPCSSACTCRRCRRSPRCRVSGR